MCPTIIDLFGLRIQSYTFMLQIAFVVCTLLAVRHAKRLNIPLTADIGLYVFFGALFGAKVFWILQYAGPGQLWRAFFLWEEGLVFYGGLIGGLAGVLAYSYARKLPLYKCSDIVAPQVALGEAIVRVGCFLNGCCWGSVAGVPWAVQFPPHSLAWEQQLRLGLIAPSAPHSLPVHPTQMYMTGSLIVVFLLLAVYSRRKPFDGAVVLAYFFLYGMVRFVVEVFRHTGHGGDSTGSVLGMTVSQSISLGMVLGSLALYWAMNRRARARQSKAVVRRKRK
jgi:phosphatidylglycerol:prolipoprotein diacylglycerol transferase